MNYSIKKSSDETVRCKVYFDGKQNTKFEKRVNTYLKSVSSLFPFLKQLDIIFETRNTFPHSAGIASSASGMSALALCLCSVENDHFRAIPEDNFQRKASYVARLGSGSACRSVYGNYVTWGKNETVEGSSDEVAVPVSFPVHSYFRSMRDTILIVSEAEKEVSSSKGHELMNHHPFSRARFSQARQNLKTIITAMKKGDSTTFSEVVENEAMMLHGLMMSSNPYMLLLKPETIGIIKKIRDYRKQSGAFICFTLDAGPNIHLLYPESESEKVDSFIAGELNNLFLFRIDDKAGQGPQRLSI